MKIGYRRLCQNTWHIHDVLPSTYDGIMAEYGTLKAYFNSMVFEEIEVVEVR